MSSRDARQAKGRTEGTEWENGGDGENGKTQRNGGKTEKPKDFSVRLSFSVSLSVTASFALIERPALARDVPLSVWRLHVMPPFSWPLVIEKDQPRVALAVG
jgi:hypothetical protein